MAKKTILIIDYGVGNHQSIANALTYLAYKYWVSNLAAQIKKADAYILPGVGAFEEAMSKLNALGIIEDLREQVIMQHKPLLGICLGMQILADDGEENGLHQGLGFIPGHVKKIDTGGQYPVPHVGWNTINIKQQEPLFLRSDEGASFYFDHSYHFSCDDDFISSTCDYGSELTASVQMGNIHGVQFHPEKSQHHGLKLFRSFFNHYGF